MNDTFENKFYNQFIDVTQDDSLRSRVNEILTLSKVEDSFINYFGINYSQDKLLSVKLYFSYLKMPSNDVFKAFGVSDEHISKIKSEWDEVDNYTFVHQGITFALKCYLQNDGIIVNNYFGYRTKLPVLGKTNIINLEQDDLFYPGYCIEYYSNKKYAEKRYFFIRSEKNKEILLEKFNLSSLISSNELVEIEYAEHEEMSKINLGVKSTNTIEKLFKIDNNKYVDYFNSIMFNKYDLYYYGYGMRLNSKARAIYYLPKFALGDFVPFQSASIFFKNN